MTRVRLLDSDGSVTSDELVASPEAARPAPAPTTRTVYAAAHVIPKVSAENVPGHPAAIDWDQTLAFRHHIWSWGLGVADAMDTAQRNMGLDWPATDELIRRSAHEAAVVGGRLVVGVNTDHIDEAQVPLEKVVDGYRMQLQTAEDAGAGAVLMASRHLAHTAEGPADYERVYREVLESAGAPVVLHWLGRAFDPHLAGYFGADLSTATETVLRIIGDNPGKISGIKMSLLDVDAEIAVRRHLPAGVSMFTGDDFHYVDLIAGDALGHSDALLGAFAAVAPSAARALAKLDAGDIAEYRAILEPTEALSRHIFAEPTQFYKTGVAFLSWLNGHQAAFTMVGGLHAGRSLPHLSEIVRLANRARALEKPELAAERWNALLALNGV